MPDELLTTTRAGCWARCRRVDLDSVVYVNGR